jgi:hypothetical protein
MKVFFFNGKYIINNNQVSVQYEQRPEKRSYKTKVSYISGTPMKIPKQTLPSRGLFK